MFDYANFFSQLNNDQQHQLSNLAVVREFVDDELIGSLGNNSNDIYILVKGRVKIFELTAEGKEVITCRPADLLEPEWDGVVKELGDKYTSEEDRLTYAMFPKVALKFFETRGQPAMSAPSVPASGNGQNAPAPAVAVATAAPQSAPQGGASAYVVKVNGTSYSVEVHAAGAVAVSSQPTPAPSPVPVAAPATPAPASGNQQTIPAPLPGSVFSIKCKVGDTVAPGDVVIVLEAMKMETEVNSPVGGKVSSILVQEGANVQTGDTLILID